MKQSHGDKTREKILKAGVDLWPHASPTAIARELDMTHPAVLYHFPDDSLLDAIAEYAVKIGESRVILQLIASRHKAVKKLSVADRVRHFNAV